MWNLEDVSQAHTQASSIRLLTVTKFLFIAHFAALKQERFLAETRQHYGTQNEEDRISHFCWLSSFSEPIPESLEMTSVSCFVFQVWLRLQQIKTRRPQDRLGDSDPHQDHQLQELQLRTTDHGLHPPGGVLPGAVQGPAGGCSPTAPHRQRHRHRHWQQWRCAGQAACLTRWALLGQHGWGCRQDPGPDCDCPGGNQVDLWLTNKHTRIWSDISTLFHRRQSVLYICDFTFANRCACRRAVNRENECTEEFKGPYHIQRLALEQLQQNCERQWVVWTVSHHTSERFIVCYKWEAKHITLWGFRYKER